MRETLPPEVVDEALRLYDGGRVTIVEITRRTGVARASLYYHLRKRGVVPNRLGSRVVAVETEMDRLRRQNEVLTRALEKLLGP